MEIRRAQCEEESRQLDQLLWDVLWGPLGFPRDIRGEFERGGAVFDVVFVEGEDSVFDVVAVEGGDVVGGLVAGWVGAGRIEIRYFAVRPDHQRQGVGAKLLSCLAEITATRAPVTIETHSRNTSLGFYQKQGFEAIDDEWEEFALFTEHGIRFRKMRRQVGA